MLITGTNGMNSLIGWAGGIILALSSFPQAVKTVRDGHADGLSSLFIASWLIGEVLSLIYVLPTFNLPLIANYSINLLIILLIGFYKIFPRFSRTVNTLSRDEIQNILRQIK